MRNRFDDMLDELKVELIRMGALCEEGISTAVKAISKDESLVEKVADIEKQIDDKETLIEATCMRMLLMQHPVATDLRQISSSLKMISDMERIGDQALDIAEMARYLRNGHKKMQELEKMAEVTIAMVTKSIDSYVKNDMEMAKQVMLQDDEVDRMFYEIKHEIIDMIGHDHEDGEYLTDVLMVAKYFERIADHATNIVEAVVYASTGIHEKC